MSDTKGRSKEKKEKENLEYQRKGRKWEKRSYSWGCPITAMVQTGKRNGRENRFRLTLFLRREKGTGVGEGPGVVLSEPKVVFKARKVKGGNRRGLYTLVYIWRGIGVGRGAGGDRQVGTNR